MIRMRVLPDRAPRDGVGCDDGDDGAVCDREDEACSDRHGDPDDDCDGAALMRPSLCARIAT